MTIRTSIFCLLILAAFWPLSAFAMHIADGLLPASWAGLWFAIVAPFWLWGIREVRRLNSQSPYARPLLGLLGAAVFVISCLPVPVPFAGTCSHPCGAALAAIFLGPALTVVVSSVVLLLQALFLAHGGFTTLGANMFSMGVAGAFVGYGVYRLALRLHWGLGLAAFLAGLAADWITYATASFQLAIALHSDGSFLSMFLGMLVGFMPTQIPLGIVEGLITAGACLFIKRRKPELFNLRGTN